MRFDALLLVSFGGPEGPDDVMPFLRNVVRGRGVPDERLANVAEQYQRFGGVSPINGLNRQLVADLRTEIAARGWNLPVYWGNRNWHPYLDEAIAEMRADGVENAAAFVTSAYSSYSSCRLYVDDIEAARSKVGDGAPAVAKLNPFFDQPGFLDPLADGLRVALAEHPDAQILMTAHSIPRAMADACDYEEQLREVVSRVAKAAGAAHAEPKLVFQSRSGRPDQPWLGPDINEAIDALPAGTGRVVVVPIGFVSDHMEVVHDLDLVAAETAARRGVTFIRTPTAGTDPRFVAMILDLVSEADVKGAAVTCPCRPNCCAPIR